MSPSPAPHTDLPSLLDQAGIGRHSAIRVTGAGGLPLLLWLCRRGYEHVAYARSDHRGPHEPADAVLVAQLCEPSSLARILAAGPMVADGGVLIAQAASPGEAWRPNPYGRLLEAAGYEELSCIRGRRRELHIARRRLTTAPRKAA